VEILHGLDEMRLAQDEIDGFRLIDLNGLDVHVHLVQLGIS
jgi:hypothetical protein